MHFNRDKQDGQDKFKTKNCPFQKLYSLFFLFILTIPVHLNY